MIVLELVPWPLWTALGIAALVAGRASGVLVVRSPRLRSAAQLGAAFLAGFLVRGAG